MNMRTPIGGSVSGDGAGAHLLVSDASAGRREDRAVTVRCAVAPGPSSPIVVEAVTAGGGTLVDGADVAQAECLIWADPHDVGALAEMLAAMPSVRWIQLPSAGVEKFYSMFDDARIWTSTKGAYAEPVAEHALALGLAGLRHLPARARARAWGEPAGRRLMGQQVTIVGGGGIARALIALLEPFGVRITVVRRRVEPVGGAGSVVEPGRLHDVLPGAALVVLALALTPETAGLIGAAELDRMDADAWLVNVARGGHVVTDDLVDALRTRVIGGAALDVTDPEPLPPGHPLWELENCLITPHVASTREMAEPLFAERVRQNVERFRTSQPLLGLVDPTLGY
jgi:phosphoglycerate dehydrogenase-like enzyme